MVPEARDMEPSMLMSIPSSCATTAEGSLQSRKERTPATVSKDIGAGSVERKAAEHGHLTKTITYRRSGLSHQLLLTSRSKRGNLGQQSKKQKGSSFLTFQVVLLPRLRTSMSSV